jgi:hypothetical protein
MAMEKPMNPNNPQFLIWAARTFFPHLTLSAGVQCVLAVLANRRQRKDKP